MTSTPAQVTHSYPSVRIAPVRGLNRVDSARYLGICPTSFDELRRSGLVAKPRKYGNRLLWDIRDLDECFDRLPRDGEDVAPKGSKPANDDGLESW